MFGGIAATCVVRNSIFCVCYKGKHNNIQCIQKHTAMIIVNSLSLSSGIVADKGDSDRSGIAW